MCIACELNLTWLDYLESRDLAGPDGRVAAPLPFGVASKPPSNAARQDAQTAETNKFSCDDPTAGAADLKFGRASRKPE
jgi:hypothetical protein